MSEQAAQDLAELGYTQIYAVPGGMIAWEASGHTLISNQ
jgi:rhodanese-related sulfurtransferase